MHVCLEGDAAEIEIQLVKSHLHSSSAPVVQLLGYTFRMPATRSQSSKRSTRRTTSAREKEPVPEKKAGKGKGKKPNATRASTGLTTTDDTITDPVLVDHPYIELVHEELTRAWQVNKHNPMAFIFDAVSPARIFLPGREYSDNKPFVPYTQKWIDQSTELDPEGRLMQFVPKPYR